MIKIRPAAHPAGGSTSKTIAPTVTAYVEEILAEGLYDTPSDGRNLRRELRALKAVARLAESCVADVWIEMDLADQGELNEKLERALKRLHAQRTPQSPR